MRVPSSWRTGAACCIAGWWARANMKPKPSPSIDSRDPLGRLLELEPERLEHVGGAARRAGGPVAVLRDACSGRGGDEAGCRRDVERARAVASGADDVDDVLARGRDGHARAPTSPRRSRRSRRRLALHAQGDEEAADLRRRRLAAHDLAHHLARLRRGLSERPSRRSRIASWITVAPRKFSAIVGPERGEHALRVELDTLDRVGRGGARPSPRRPPSAP